MKEYEDSANSHWGPLVLLALCVTRLHLARRFKGGGPEARGPDIILLIFSGPPPCVHQAYL